MEYNSSAQERKIVQIGSNKLKKVLKVDRGEYWSIVVFIRRLTEQNNVIIVFHCYSNDLCCSRFNKII